MHSQHHPDPELLDRLRAGLLDAETETRMALEQHVADCAVCRQQLDAWRQLGTDALGPRLDSRLLADELQAARRRALGSQGITAGNRYRAAVPYAAAAVLLIAVSAGLWSLFPHGADTPAVVATRSTQQVPDVYEDLDFYLWLATQQDNGNGEEHGDPNNT